MKIPSVELSKGGGSGYVGNKKGAEMCVKALKCGLKPTFFARNREGGVRAVVVSAFT